METQGQPKGEFDHKKFQRQVQWLKNNKELTPAKMVVLNPDSKLNIIFDIDHTLIFALDKKLFPNLDQTEMGQQWGPSRLKHLRLPGTEMWLIIRHGVPEALEYLSEFCNFFVYSHGLKHYIKGILELIDPNEKFFKNREVTVIAPANMEQQRAFVNNQKSIRDYRHPDDQNKCLFSEADI